jgi:hypothetical protein
MEQTAVEWLYERLERMIPRTALYNIDKEEYFQQAKEMEKQQLKEIYLKGIKNYDSATPWYDEEQTLERMNVVGQNGNDGKHY